MSHIYVNSVSFEHELSSSFHDILLCQQTNTPSIGEVIHSNSHVYVNCVNLEIPATAVPTETFTCVQTATHTILEEISGTPEPEPEAPAFGGGVSQRPRVLGGRPWQEEKIKTYAIAEQFLEEQILVEEIAQTYAYNTSGLETLVRKPIYKQPRQVQIKTFTLAKDKSITISPEPYSPNGRQKEEEELLLLGII